MPPPAAAAIGRDSIPAIAQFCARERRTYIRGSRSRDRPADIEPQPSPADVAAITRISIGRALAGSRARVRGPAVHVPRRRSTASLAQFGNLLYRGRGGGRERLADLTGLRNVPRAALVQLRAAPFMQVPLLIHNAGAPGIFHFRSAGRSCAARNWSISRLISRKFVGKVSAAGLVLRRFSSRCKRHFKSEGVCAGY